MEEEGDLRLLVFYNNGARASELEEQIFVMPNCPELEEGVFIASAQNPTVGHLSSSASVEEPGRPDAPPEQPACGPVDRARRRAFSVTPRLRPAYGPVWTGPSGAPSGAPGQAPGVLCYASVEPGEWSGVDRETR